MKVAALPEHHVTRPDIKTDPLMSRRTRSPHRFARVAAHSRHRYIKAIYLSPMVMILACCSCGLNHRFVTVAGIPGSEISRVQHMLAKHGIPSDWGDGGRGGAALMVPETRPYEARQLLIEDSHRFGYHLVLRKTPG
jgi:hypothetical protein